MHCSGSGELLPDKQNGRPEEKPLDQTGVPVLVWRLPEVTVCLCDDAKPEINRKTSILTRTNIQFSPFSDDNIFVLKKVKIKKISII